MCSFLRNNNTLFHNTHAHFAKKKTKKKKMPKERFSAFDVCAEVSCLRRTVLGLWCAQIYDAEGGKNALLFKFNRGGNGGEEGEENNNNESSKVHVFVQPGVKLIATRYPRTTTTTTHHHHHQQHHQQPSNFVQKLRKHCAKKRLNDIRQLGMDRAVVLTFGAKETETKLVVELYASGNAILCDGEFTALTVLRTLVEKTKNVKIMGKRRYPVERFRAFRMPTRETWEEALRGVYAEEERAVWNADCLEDEKGEDIQAAAREEKKRRERERLENIRAPQTLRECLCRGFSFAPAQCEHVALRAGV